MSDEVDEEFGQSCRLVPMSASPNRRSAADPSREVFDFCGVFDWQWTDISSSGVEVSSRSPWVFTQRYHLGYMPRHLDRIQLTFDHELLTFEINDVQRDGVSGVVLRLNQIGVQR